MSTGIALWIVVAALVLAISLIRLNVPTQTSPLPPGPKPLPFIGNALDVPAHLAWRTYAKWRDTYVGDVIFMRVFGMPMIVLNSLGGVVDLLEKRSSNYSDRLQAEMVTLIGWNWTLGAMEYGQKWRRRRRIFHQHFNQTAVRQYKPQIRLFSRQLLKRFYEEPEEFEHHIHYVLGANILSVAYGLEIAEKNDIHIIVAEKAMEAHVQVVIPGSFWVDFMPFLKYLPAWIPGAGFQKKAADWRVNTTAMKELPCQSVAARLSERMSHLEGEALAAEEDVSKDVLGLSSTNPVLNIDQIASTITSLVLAMVLYPDVQKRAQAELDQAVGTSRLPDFPDRESLPYIQAICKEALRWQPAAPFGAAHRSIADDEYNGYHIPAGILILENIWAILHDPMVYSQPEDFIPERFLKDGRINPGVLDPSVASFGAGRRICPGRYYSELILFIYVACILHTFDIMPALDENNQPIRPEPKMTSGSVSFPEPFKCIIKPRSALAEKLTAET
ncbi:hypothetical protein CERSUDRAFT_151145 [Gelatoporia subvermispora B]|uniref:Cytochrome P450 n=1 Tax=Ceriporiopsis subvermispora (strain B) TaxID=914234 RepID=M2RNY7_CERS8|nr:hypothetical protein CERSUDRAFT_151145 [Gelatoporia subvermispora B]